MKNLKKQWFAVYTRSKWEKKVHTLFEKQGIASFCPLVKSRRQWADRKKTVEIPLFSSYVFVNVTTLELEKIRQTNGVISFVYHCGLPASIDDCEIQRIAKLTETYTEVEAISLEPINIGDKVKVSKGFLSDWQGEVITVNGKSVVMVLEQFNCALIAKVNINTREILHAD